MSRFCATQALKSMAWTLSYVSRMDHGILTYPHAHPKVIHDVKTTCLQGHLVVHEMSRIVRKSNFCLCENKGPDQLRSYCEADQRLCFRYTDSAISLLLKSEISSFLPPSLNVQVGLYQTWSETRKTGFLASRLKYRQSWASFHSSHKLAYL